MISQEFKAHVALETYVILGNDALVKCEIPSFVSDLVTINGWMDDENNDFFAQEHTVSLLYFFEWVQSSTQIRN